MFGMFLCEGLIGEYVMAVCAFYELDCKCMRGWYWCLYLVLGLVHLRSQSGIVWLGGLLLNLRALVSVKNRVFLLACSIWVMRCTALLCRAILRPFINGVLHIDRRCGHVSMLLLWHIVQLGFWCVRGHNIYFSIITHVLRKSEF